MSHHGPNPFDPGGPEREPEGLRQIKKKLLETTSALAQFGDTGQYPQGQLNADDEGEIRFGVAAHRGKVVINFGKPVHWMGMDPIQAKRLALMLIRKADEARIIRPANG